MVTDGVHPVRALETHPVKCEYRSDVAFCPAADCGFREPGGSGREDEHRHIGRRAVASVGVWCSNGFDSVYLCFDLGRERYDLNSAFSLAAEIR